ncbi:MAG: class I adenylate-forming enzyme family protein [Thermomicrobiales bacterium]
MSATTAPTPQPVSYGRRLTQLAEERPDATALIFAPLHGAERRTTWAELERQANQVARLLADRGIGERDTVVIGFPNSPEHVVISFALWKLGAMVLTLRAALPPYERDAILDLATPRSSSPTGPASPTPASPRRPRPRRRVPPPIPSPTTSPSPAAPSPPAAPPAAPRSSSPPAGRKATRRTSRSS